MKLGLMGGALAVTMMMSAPAAAQVRKSITQLTPAELQSLRNGYAQMIAWNSAPQNSANFRRSLRFWANIHAYFGQGCASTNGLNNQGMNGITAQNPTLPAELATWCTCVHGGNQFLTWHRMYLWYFERALRAAANDPNLTLPFWNYQTDGTLPPAFRSPTYVNANGQTVANPLYVANRQAQLNAGTSGLSSAATSTTAAMALTDYVSFNSSIEQAPHGAVHCATGVAGCPTGFMGSVPAAGNDPIFYTHHANIDRLYECWLNVASTQRLPPANLRTAQFTFIDGQGNQVTRTVADMLTTQQLGYSYASGGGCPLRIRRPPRWWEVEWRPRIPPFPWRERVPLDLPRDVLRDVQRANAARLVLEEPRVTESPTGLVEVGLQGADGKFVSVGVLSAFNESAPPHRHAAGAMMEPRQVSFDAKDALLKAGTGARVIVRPVSGLTGQGAGFADPAAVAGKPATLDAKSARIEVR